MRRRKLLACEQFELQQKVDKTKVEVRQHTKEFDHWTAKLGKLELHKIDDEDDEDDVEEPAPEPEDGEGDGDEGQAPVKKPANKLKRYTDEELEELDTDALKAEIAILEGARVCLFLKV